MEPIDVALVDRLRAAPIAKSGGHKVHVLGRRVLEQTVDATDKVAGILRAERDGHGRLEMRGRDARDLRERERALVLALEVVRHGKWRVVLHNHDFRRDFAHLHVPELDRVDLLRAVTAAAQARTVHTRLK